MQRLPQTQNFLVDEACNLSVSSQQNPSFIKELYQNQNQVQQFLKNGLFTRTVGFQYAQNPGVFAQGYKISHRFLLTWRRTPRIHSGRSKSCMWAIIPFGMLSFCFLAACPKPLITSPKGHECNLSTVIVGSSPQIQHHLDQTFITFPRPYRPTQPAPPNRAHGLPKSLDHSAIRRARHHMATRPPRSILASLHALARPASKETNTSEKNKSVAKTRTSSQTQSSSSYHQYHRPPSKKYLGTGCEANIALSCSIPTATKKG